MFNKRIIDRMFISPVIDTNVKLSRLARKIVQYIVGGSLVVAGYHIGKNNFVDRSDIDLDTLQHILLRKDNHMLTPLFLEDHPNTLERYLETDNIYLLSLEQALFEPTQDTIVSSLTHEGTGIPYEHKAKNHIEIDNCVYLSTNDLTNSLWYNPRHNIVYDFDNDKLYTPNTEKNTLEHIASNVRAARQVRDTTYFIQNNHILAIDDTNITRIARDFEEPEFISHIYGTDIVIAGNEDSYTPITGTIGKSLRTAMDQLFEEHHVQPRDVLAYHHGMLYCAHESSVYTSSSYSGIEEHDIDSDIQDVAAITIEGEDFVLFLNEDHSVHQFQRNEHIQGQYHRKLKKLQDLKYTRWLDHQTFTKQLKQYTHNTEETP